MQTSNHHIYKVWENFCINWPKAAHFQSEYHEPGWTAFYSTTNTVTETGPHSVVFSAMDCGSGLGFKSHQSYGIFQPWLAPAQNRECHGPNGKAGTTEGCVFESVALITGPTLQVLQFPGLVNTGIIMTLSVICGPNPNRPQQHHQLSSSLIIAYKSQFLQPFMPCSCGDLSLNVPASLLAWGSSDQSPRRQRVPYGGGMSLQSALWGEESSLSLTATWLSFSSVGGIVGGVQCMLNQNKWCKDTFSTLHYHALVIFATVTVVAFVPLHNSRFNFHCYTLCEAMPTQKLAQKWHCNLSWLLAWKITKGILSCKPASLNRPI